MTGEERREQDGEKEEQDGEKEEEKRKGRLHTVPNHLFRFPEM